jgi:hypothetical protein
MLLSDLLDTSRTVAVVGLAKNTGKTETLATILGELRARDRTVGVTSIGRDGEDRDVLDHAVGKPPIRLAAGSLVATTDMLLRDSGVRCAVVARTGYRTPLGQVVVGRLLEGGAVQVAGPSTARATRAVADTLLDLGARQVLVDGALDRRMAAAPAVADAVVLATGAVLHNDMAEVAAQTRRAADLLRLPEVLDQRVRELAVRSAGNLLVTDGRPPMTVDPQVVLSGSPADVGRLFDRQSGAGHHLVVRGALCERFVENVRRAVRGRPVTLVIGDSTKVFLSRRSCEWYRRQSVRIEALRPIRLAAVTVNPVAPRSHRFDSRSLREHIRDALPDVFVCDVRHPDYHGSATR